MGITLPAQALDPQVLERLPQVYPGAPIPLMWKRLVTLKVENPSITGKELSKALGVNAQTIYRIEKTFEYQQYEEWVLKGLKPEVSTLIAQEQKDALETAKAKFETYLDEMQDRLIHIMQTTESEALQVKIIQDSMDRVGFGVKRDEKRTTPIVMTAEAMAEFMRRATEAGIAAPSNVIEGEVAT